MRINLNLLRFPIPVSNTRYMIQVTLDL